MDTASIVLHISNMTAHEPIPDYALYGETGAFPDLLHAETVQDRASLHDWRIAPHRHEGLSQVFVLVRGGGRITVDGHEHALALPGLIFMPRRVVHGFTFAQGTVGHVITLPDRAFPEVFGPASALAPRLKLWCAASAPRSSRMLADAIAREHRGRAPFRDPMLRGLVMSLLSEVARAARPADAPAKRSRAAAHMDRFDRLIRAHLRDRWRVSDYADAVGLTPQQLNRICRGETGRAAAAHVEAQLFQEARRHLAYTRMTVAEVGYRLGFDDPAYFSRAFRRHTGQTPSEYREGVDPS